MGTRDRVALVFVIAAVVVTVGLGSMVAYQFAHPPVLRTSVAVAVPGAPGQADPTGPSGAPGGGGDATAAPSGGRWGPGAGAASTLSHAEAVAAPAGAALPGGDITVGGIFEETGPVDASVGRDTVRAYFDEVNAAGGVNGHRLRLVDCDSAFDPTRGHQCSERLASAGVLAIVGWLSPSSEQTEAQYLTQRGIPIFGGLGIGAEFSSPLSFPVGINLGRAVELYCAHAAELGVRAPALVIINTPFTSPSASLFTDALHRHGIHEKSVDFVDATKPDYTDLAVKIRLEGADSIMAGLDPFSYARFFQALDRQNFHPLFMGVGLDKRSAEKQYGPAVYGAESGTAVLEPDEHMDLPAMREYYSAIQRYYPAEVDDLDVWSEQTWVSARVFVEALRRIGPAPVTARSLVDAANRIRNLETGLTVPLSYSPGSHDPNHCLQWIRNQHGTWHTYSGWTCL
jgi:branched-chain amino acid transport system substrate-binding protein